jgi:hypothetical protein
LGLGLPWVISSIYQSKQDPPQDFEVPPGDLAFSVMLYLMTSLVCFVILIFRRIVIKGELGGPPTSKYLSALILVLLWLIYVIGSSLKAYGKI